MSKITMKSGKKKKISKDLLFNEREMMSKALSCHQSGALEKAKELYQKVLKIIPDNSEALYGLGIISHQTGDNHKASSLIKQAIQIDPSNCIYYNNLGLILIHVPKYLDEAVSCLKKAISLNSNYTDAFYNIGIAYHRKGDFKQAILAYKKAIELRPDDPKIYNNLGIVCKLDENLSEAVNCYQKALRIKPDYIEALNNLGNAFKEQKKFNEAIECYQNILKINQSVAEIYLNLGNVFKETGNFDQTLKYYRKAIELKPELVETYNNIGTVFHELGELGEAIENFQKAIDLRPDYSEAYNNLGMTFKESGKFNEAIKCCEKALQINSEYSEGYFNLGSIFQDKNDLSKSISFYQKALEIKPGYEKALSRIFYQLQQVCDWQEMGEFEEKLDKLTKTSLENNLKPAEDPFMNIARKQDPALNYAIAKGWSDEISRQADSVNISFNFNRPVNHKIVVGYISNDFRNHAVGHLIQRLFALHDRQNFKIICYSCSRDDGSHFRSTIKDSCDKFVDINNFSHLKAARLIYDDNVDILVDMMGYTTGSRIMISAFKPAPIQVSYLGFLGTTGSGFIDYLVTDKIVSPPEHADYYSESFIYMPHCYQINNNFQSIADLNIRKKDVGLPEEGFVFCSFNQNYKIDQILCNTWMRILNQVPGSVLWLLRNDEYVENNLKKEARRREIDPERLVFAEKIPLDKHIYRIKLADVALDTRIYNGGATTSNALWAGVPVITIKGSHFVSRMSSSCLTAMGMTELIASDLMEYESLAIRLSKDTSYLAMIKEKIGNNKKTQPFFDTERYVKNLEKAYIKIWEIFKNGDKPREIEIKD